MNIATYLKETRAELAHVTWPTRRQAIGFTLLVIGISVALAFFLGLFDYLFSFIIKSFVL